MLFLIIDLSVIFYVLDKAYNDHEKYYLDEVQGVNYTLFNKDYFYNSPYLKYEDEYYTSSFGIDVSTFQDDIDWEKVKDAGVDFVFIRIGRRGATTNLLYIDDKFINNYNGAKENDIDVGVYFFSQAITPQEAIEDADYCLSLLGGRKLDLPIVLDYEESGITDETPRTYGMTKQQATENAIAFCEEIKKHNYDVMIYSYKYWMDNFYDMEQLKDYDFWFAQYDVETPTIKHPILYWQYSCIGEIDGIDNDVDLNIRFIKKEDNNE